MIYRILVDDRYHCMTIYDEYLADPNNHDEKPGLRGASFGWLASIMFQNQLKVPSFNNDRCRFFFTEEGWYKVGRKVAAEAVRLGHVVKVIRRKNPNQSQVFYRDAFQVALLPPSGQPARRRT